MANSYTAGSGEDRAVAVRKYLRAGRPSSRHAGKHAGRDGHTAKKRQLHPSPSRRVQTRQNKRAQVQAMTDAEWEQYVLDSPAFVPDVEPPTPPDRSSSWYDRYWTFRFIAAMVLIGLLFVFVAIEYANRLMGGSAQLTTDGCLLLLFAPLLVLGLVAWWFAWRHGSD